MSIVVIGGGPAGASAACRLAQAGRAVVLLEREAAPAHKICGEFISIEARRDLSAIGLDIAALGAKPIDTVRVIRGDRVAEARLPFTGMSLSRRRLDEALLAHAARAGVQVHRGHAVRRITAENAVEVPALGSIPAKHLLLATGKHELRGQRRAAVPSDFIGLKSYFSANAAALAGVVEVVLFAGGYAGLQCVEDGLVNLCLLVEQRCFAAHGGTWRSFLAALLLENAHLRRRLADGAEMLARPLSIAQVPYGFLHTPSARDPAALFRLGDQMGVIPSFTGDGIAIALHTARRASESLLAGADAHAYHRRMRVELRRPIRVATALQRAGRSPLGAAVLLGAMRIPGLLAGLARLTRVAQAM